MRKELFEELLESVQPPQTERVLFTVNAWQGQNMGEIRG